MDTFHCCQPEFEIDLRDIPPNSYNTGDRIIGCLNTLGWVVCRGVRATDEVYQDIDCVCQSGRQPNGTWFHVDTRGNRKMKYQHSTQYVKEDLDSNFPQFRNQINTEILARILPKEQQYKIGKYNILQNSGIINDDQEPHRDYPARCSL